MKVPVKIAIKLVCTYKLHIAPMHELIIREGEN